jgi:hypothetical protein
MFRSVSWKLPAAIAALCCWSAIGAAQPGRVYTAADYAKAEKFMDYNVNPLVFHTVEDPAWLADGRFWYRDTGSDGVTFMLVDPAKRTKAPAFDHGKLAAVLNAGKLGMGLRSSADAGHLPIDDHQAGGWRPRGAADDWAATWFGAICADAGACRECRRVIHGTSGCGVRCFAQRGRQRSFAITTCGCAMWRAGATPS